MTDIRDRGTEYDVDYDTAIAAVHQLTGKPVTAGTPQLTFLAVLVPLTSDGVTFHAYPDGRLEAMYAPCPSCGQDLPVFDFAEDDTFPGPYPNYQRVLARRRDIARRKTLARLAKRVFGCSCRG